MIFIKLHDTTIPDSTTIGSENPLYICDSNSKLVNGQGYEKDGQYYYPALLNQPSFSARGKNLIEMGGAIIEIDQEFASRFSSDEIDCIVWLWNEEASDNKFMILDGKALLNKYDSFSYTYRVEEQDYGLNDDLLSAAPDLKNLIGDSDTFVNNRVYPMHFGYLKYITPFKLANNTQSGVWYSDGKTTKMFDGGRNVNYSQSTNEVTKTGSKAIYEITLDVDASSASTGSDTGLADAKPYGIVQSYNGDGSTATRLTINGAKIATQGADRVTNVLTEDGQSHWYYHNGSNWVEIANIGLSTTGSDFAIGYFASTGSLQIPVYALAAAGGTRAGYFYSINYYGIQGISDNSYGVVGTSTNSVGGLFSGSAGNIQLPTITAPSTAGWGASEAGRQYFNTGAGGAFSTLKAWAKDETDTYSFRDLIRPQIENNSAVIANITLKFKVVTITLNVGVTFNFANHNISNAITNHRILDISSSVNIGVGIINIYDDDGLSSSDYSVKLLEYDATTIRLTRYTSTASATFRVLITYV